jgi:dsDNA-binding SOS-regulon protein
MANLKGPDSEHLGIPNRTIESWNFTIKDPDDRRVTLIPFDRLADKYKDIVNKAFGGDVYAYHALEPIKNLVRKDYKAEEFFQNFTFPDGRTLYSDIKGSERLYINRYTNDASWLNMISRINGNKQALKNELPKLTMESFWQSVCTLIAQEQNTDIPASERGIRRKLATYKEEGYPGLISKRFGNKNTSKIGKSEAGYDSDLAKKQESAIRKLLTIHNNLDNVQISNLANILFEKNGWQTISPATIYNYRQQFEHITTAGRRGLREHRSKRSMQIHREAPTYPLAMVTVDGWTAELLYQERVTDSKGNTHVDYNKRLVVVVVLDPFLKYPIGYAIGERENTELIRMANRNAMSHIAELFGDTFRPHQVQSDRYGLKQLTPFYSAMSHLFTPAAVGNAKAKVIEPYFKYLNKSYCQLDKFWSGFGIQSNKDSQPNAEYLDKIKHQMPDKAGVYAKIEAIIHRERAKKQEKYVQKWAELAENDRSKLALDQYLQVFGSKTMLPSKQEPRGLTPTLLGVERVFDTFDPQFKALSHLKWHVYYDETDLNQVLAISEDNKYRFMLERPLYVPMAIRDQGQEHFDYRKRVKQYNTDQENHIISTYAEDSDTMMQLIENTPLSLEDHQEAALKLMFTNNGQQKEGLQNAKRLGSNRPAPKQIDKPVSNWNEEQIKYLESKVDFNQYLD